LNLRNGRSDTSVQSKYVRSCNKLHSMPRLFQQAYANTAAETAENAANAPSRKRARPQGVSRISKAAKTMQDTLHSGVVQSVVELLQERNTTLADVLNCKAGGRAFSELSGLQLEVRKSWGHCRHDTEECGITQQKGSPCKPVARGPENHDAKVLTVSDPPLCGEFQSPFVRRQSAL
jgi:hypothetical protein